MRTIIGVTGASGAAVAVEFLKRCGGEKYLIVSRWGKAVLAQETGETPESLSPYVQKVFSNDDMNAPFASGSVPFDQVVIVPCSMTTLGRIAHGVGENLIARVGEVALKEGRRLVLVLRESPLSPIALENALTLSRCGVTIMPFSPPLYLKPSSVEELVSLFVDHMLTTLNSPQRPGWHEKELLPGKGSSLPFSLLNTEGKRET
ncbi:MAG: UbiX family flavin prenyltransferase [Elusimicrobia bacterium]|nr:UbiX family flavin prenyltransferase [Candidatus Obscuribacterium magneticum]